MKTDLISLISLTDTISLILITKELVKKFNFENISVRYFNEILYGLSNCSIQY